LDVLLWVWLFFFCGGGVFGFFFWWGGGVVPNHSIGNRRRLVRLDQKRREKEGDRMFWPKGEGEKKRRAEQARASPDGSQAYGTHLRPVGKRKEKLPGQRETGEMGAFRPIPIGSEANAAKSTERQSKGLQKMERSNQGLKNEDPFWDSQPNENVTTHASTDPNGRD